jgi:hypothetical protein
MCINYLFSTGTNWKDQDTTSTMPKMQTVCQRWLRMTERDNQTLKALVGTTTLPLEAPTVHK